MNMALVMNLKGWGIRQAIREVGGNERLREACLIQEDEEVYPRSVVSRFIRRLEKVIQAIFEGEVVQLLKRIKARRLVAVLDAIFQKAWSRRDPENSRVGFSDKDARVGKAPGGKKLGYKAHLATIPGHEIIIALVTASANQNEKRHAEALLERAEGALRSAGKGLKRAIADSQFSFEAFRKSLAGKDVEAIIPYPANQRKGERGLLRVDKKFRTHGPYHQRLKYRERIAAEHVGARLKLHTAFNRLKVRGLSMVETHDLVSALCLNLIWEAAHNLGIPRKARSITYFNT